MKRGDRCSLALAAFLAVGLGTGAMLRARPAGP